MLPTNIPFSTFFIFLLAATMALLTSLANRLLTDPEESKMRRKEIADWTSALREAKRSGDKKTQDKIMKKQQYILKLQSKMAWQSMKVTLIFLAPLFIIWQLLIGSYGVVAVAYFPGIGANLPLPLFGNSLLWWYMSCSFLFNTVFNHLFGMVGVE